MALTEEQEKSLLELLKKQAAPAPEPPAPAPEPPAPAPEPGEELEKFKLENERLKAQIELLTKLNAQQHIEVPEPGKLSKDDIAEVIAAIKK